MSIVTKCLYNDQRDDQACARSYEFEYFHNGSAAAKAFSGVSFYFEHRSPNHDICVIFSFESAAQEVPEGYKKIYMLTGLPVPNHSARLKRKSPETLSHSQ